MRRPAVPTTRYSKVVLFLLSIFSLLTLNPAPAQAHAQLINTYPLANSVLTTAPANITLTWGEKVQTNSDEVLLADSTGTKVATSYAMKLDTHAEQSSPSRFIHSFVEGSKSRRAPCWRLIFLWRKSETSKGISIITRLLPRQNPAISLLGSSHSGIWFNPGRVLFHLCHYRFPWHCYRRPSHRCSLIDSARFLSRQWIFKNISPGHYRLCDSSRLFDELGIESE